MAIFPHYFTHRKLVIPGKKPFFYHTSYFYHVSTHLCGGLILPIIAAQSSRSHLGVQFGFLIKRKGAGDDTIHLHEIKILIAM